MSINTEHNYWFKRRRYGHGWTPVTWQGWAITIVFLAVILGSTALLMSTPQHQISTNLWVYFAIIVVDIAGLIYVARLKGPTPKSRWGKSDSDNPDEDF